MGHHVVDVDRDHALLRHRDGRVKQQATLKRQDRRLNGRLQWLGQVNDDLALIVQDAQARSLSGFKLHVAQAETFGVAMHQGTVLIISQTAGIVVRGHREARCFQAFFGECRQFFALIVQHRQEAARVGGSGDERSLVFEHLGGRI
ncbi:hypothetical protein D3C77_425330 [compost metagenome]